LGRFFLAPKNRDFFALTELILDLRHDFQKFQFFEKKWFSKSFRGYLSVFKKALFLNVSPAI